MIDTFSILTLLGVTIVVGYIGSLIFYKTKIPDVIWLLLFGLIVGPLFGLVETSMYVTISSFLAAAAILLILFDAGLNMDFYQTVKNFSRSMLFSVLGLAFSMISIGIFSWAFFGLDILTGLFIGAVLGGTSLPIVDAIVKSVKVKESVRSLLDIESIITDPMVIVIAIALLGLIIPTAGNQISAIQSILGAFSIGAVVGLSVGIVWLYMLRILRGKPFDYMLTLGVLLIIYVFVEANGGSGAIASLVFGLVLGNAETFTSIFKIRKKLELDEKMRGFQSEITFFMKAFFFVLLGLISVINVQYIVYGLVTAAILILLRFAVVYIGTRNMKLERLDRNIMRITVPRGLAAAVLAQYPMTYGIPGAEMISSIVFVVILATVVYSTVAVKVVSIMESKRPGVKQSSGKNKEEGEVVSFVKIKK
ncbi:MAG: cation:proton antiporter [Candidatus Aenigmarchaeota archaeon]|nr:cation:proton antiporter [Candidatus Aenigmarchaeota archaeon]